MLDDFKIRFSSYHKISWRSVRLILASSGGPRESGRRTPWLLLPSSSPASGAESVFSPEVVGSKVDKAIDSLRQGVSSSGKPRFEPGKKNVVGGVYARMADLV